MTRIVPVTPDRWPDLQRLFGPKGACAGCWCMYWRLPRAQFERQKGADNERALRALVEQGPPPGLMAYVDQMPAGWCAVAPREAFPRLERSRTLRRVDDLPVWCVVCVFVAKPYRRQGVQTQLLAARAFAREQGASVLEGYPVEPRSGAMPDLFAWTGTAAAFRKAGFTEVARPTPARPIVRSILGAP